ncbi:MAG: hypothetical protein N2318_10010 [Meiothermus sp.]|nr:hypothetical protein [Meiothermus sp.]
MPRRHLSGRNAQQLPKSVTDDRGEEIPVTKDAGTFIYLSEDGETWPKRPLVGLPLDVAWLQVGDVLELRNLKPGIFMGTLSHVRLVDIRTEILIHPGKWGQIRRNALAVPAETLDEYEQAVKAGVENA